MRRMAVLVVLAAGVLVAAGCGGGSSQPEESATPAEARKEIAQIRTLLDRAVADYAAGKQDAAAEAVGNVYLERFEKVEGPLGERDQELMEELEAQISTELRTAMNDGKPTGEIDALLAKIKQGLDEAEQVLG